MRVVIAGGHGKIAMILEELLAGRGDSAVGLIRSPAQVADLERVGAQAVVADLERVSVAELEPDLRGADAVVFAAGAGPGSGAERKTTVDQNAAILLADAAETAGVSRYLMVSSMGANPDARQRPGMDPVFTAYVRAKGAADADVLTRPALRSTIVRPGRLTNDPGTGLVTLAEHTGRGSIPRADVAATLLALLDAPGTAGRTYELIAGETPIAQAIAVAN